MIFAIVLARALRHPEPAVIDTVVFFGAVVFLVATGVAQLFVTPQGQGAIVLSVVRGTVALSLPYLLLRLVDDFALVPLVVRSLAIAGGVMGIASLVVFPPPYSVPHVLLLVAYFVVLQSYNTVRFIGAVGAHVGVTRARMRAAAWGSGCLALALLFAGAAAAAPAWQGLWTNLVAVGGAGCGLGYFLAFAPPRSFLRYWEAPAIRDFLASMVRLPAQDPILRIEEVVERATAAAMGAPNVLMMLWDEERQRLVAPRLAEDDAQRAPQPELTVASRVFRDRRPLAVLDTIASDPANAEVYRRLGATAVLAAPIMVDSGDRCYGVLSAFADRASVFSADELPLLSLLARHLGGFLQRREFVMNMRDLEARETATRMKDEFLSAAAHDLRTPLTVVLGLAQLLQRHLRTRPEAIEANLEEAERLTEAAQRMWRMTDEVLDASRLEAGEFTGERRRTDLVVLARDVVSTIPSPRHRLEVDGVRVEAEVDADAMRHVFQNLVDNAVKFSPAGGEVRVALRSVADEVEVRVTDRGIGVPPHDLQHLFDRFYRGGEVGRRGFGGMGIGLFLCKRIVEEHGGRIWAESRLGTGSEFVLRLPTGVTDNGGAAG
ncbi:MAG: HAMP domain-containing sensor histidine kinase [Dehalococcoidia bacterium]